MTMTTEADAQTGEAVTTLTYNYYDNITTIADPENNLTQFLEYDIMGKKKKKEDARQLFMNMTLTDVLLKP